MLLHVLFFTAAILLCAVRDAQCKTRGITLTTNFIANYQLTTVFLAKYQLTANPDGTLYVMSC